MITLSVTDIIVNILSSEYCPKEFIVDEKLINQYKFFALIFTPDIVYINTTPKAMCKAALMLPNHCTLIGDSTLKVIKCNGAPHSEVYDMGKGFPYDFIKKITKNTDSFCKEYFGGNTNGSED